MKDSKRAVRRHHVARLKKSRKNYWWTEGKTSRQIGMLVHTAALCSCWMCCNPRRAFKKKDALTVQERRFLQEN